MYFFHILLFKRIHTIKSVGPGCTPTMASLHAGAERRGFSSPGTPQKRCGKVATSRVVLTDVPLPWDSHEGLWDWEKVLTPRTAPHKHSSPPRP